MKIEPLPPPAVKAAGGWLLQHYLPLVAESRKISTDQVAKAAGSTASGKQLAHQWVKHHMAVRVRHGQYVLVDPGVAARAWALPSYYAEVLALHDALGALEATHAFACLTAARHADYVPERPLLVTPPPAGEDPLDKVERFTYAFGPDETDVLEMEAMGARFQVPVLTPEATAIVLASTGLPREAKAARELLQEMEVDEPLAMKLNALGLRTREDVFRSRDPRVTLPAFILERRARHADELLKETLS